MYADVFEDIRSRAGICNERPRGKAGLRGVMGLSSIALSSFDFFFSGSRNFGEGDSCGGPLSESDNERPLDGDREVVPPPVMPSPSFPDISAIPGSNRGCVWVSSFNWLRSIFGTVESSMSFSRDIFRMTGVYELVVGKMRSESSLFGGAY
jgi:hypothetical protein